MTLSLLVICFANEIFVGDSLLMKPGGSSHTLLTPIIVLCTIVLVIHDFCSVFVIYYVALLWKSRGQYNQFLVVPKFRTCKLGCWQTKQNYTI